MLAHGRRMHSTVNVSTRSAATSRQVAPTRAIHLHVSGLPATSSAMTLAVALVGITGSDVIVAEVHPPWTAPLGWVTCEDEPDWSELVEVGDVW